MASRPQAEASRTAGTLNWLGKAAMNNAERAAIQRRYVAPLLERLGGRVDGRRVLELGCGRGVGVEVILERFGAAEVVAIDVDPDMVDRARRRLSKPLPGRVRVEVGDACAIDAEGETFDAVFDFGAIHLVPEWRSAVREVRRVLKPGGRFFFEEVAGPFFRLMLRLSATDTPERLGDPFSGRAFLAELARHELDVGDRVVRPKAMPWLTRLAGDLIGVGVRSDRPASA